MSEFDAIVIGAGANGCATALHLARAGVKVLLLEQFEFGHARGSSHGDSRIIRLSYEHRDLTLFARSAYATWSEIEALSGARLVHRTGGIDFAEPGNASWEACRASLASADIEHAVWDAAEIRRRFPQFAIPSDWHGLWQADSGFVHADQAVRTMAQLAIEFGATLHDRTPVGAIEKIAAGWQVVTPDATFRSKYLAVAAGAWVNRLLAPVGVRLPVQISKEQWAYFATRDTSEFALGRCPIFIDYGTFAYGFPEFNRPGVKVAIHRDGVPIEIETRNFEPNRESLARLSAWVGAHLPGIDPQPLSAQTCLYTNLPDFGFLIDRIPGHDDAVIVCACSGEGFKFSAHSGLLAARLLLNGEAAPPRFRYRFG